MTVGKRIRVVRKLCGLTQKELGHAAGIAEPTIRSYELERLNPKIETIRKIAEALGLPVELLTGDQPFPDPFLENDAFLRVVPWGINANFNDEVFTSETSFGTMVNTIYDLVAELHLDSEKKSVDIIYKSNKWKGYKETKPDQNLDRISNVYHLLNEAGQQKAVERVEELAEIPKYQKKPGEE